MKDAQKRRAAGVVGNQKCCNQKVATRSGPWPWALTNEGKGRKRFVGRAPISQRKNRVGEDGRISSWGHNSQIPQIALYLAVSRRTLRGCEFFAVSGSPDYYWYSAAKTV